jgi:hypothetical protein
MRWVTYRTDAGDRAGLVVGDQIHGLPANTAVDDLLGDDGERMAEAARRATDDPAEVLSFDGADLAPPLRPPQVRDYLAFLDHLRNARGGRARWQRHFVLGSRVPPRFPRVIACPRFG